MPSNRNLVKAKMLATRLRSFIDAIEGRSRLKVGPVSIVRLMDDAATFFDRLAPGDAPARRSTMDKQFMTQHPGKYFIRQGSILVRRFFHTEAEAKNWAIENYKNRDGWTLLHPTAAP